MKLSIKPVETGGMGGFTGHGGRRSHAAQGAETSGGGWWVVGMGKFQVDGAFHQESGWGAGEINRGNKKEHYWWGER